MRIDARLAEQPEVAQDAVADVWIDRPVTRIDGLGYLAESAYRDAVTRDGFDMTFYSRHRSIDSYSRALERAAGLFIDAIREHPMPASAVGPDRSIRWTRVPLFLHLRARKPPIHA